MPSVRSLHGAFSWELFAARGLAPQSWGKLERDEHVMERDGVERFDGRLAVEHIAAASSGRGSDARYHDGTTLDFILAGIAAALPGASKITARLTTMLPVSLWHLAPKAVDALRAPVFEDKVVDHLVGLAKVTDKEISKEKLQKAVEALDEM